ncbi:MAG: hypothetical protein P8L22_06595, partial [Acidimicrobiales bacterium]|nr:hypothetical protein [Acidimicrobiales bacterium]
MSLGIPNSKIILAVMTVASIVCIWLAAWSIDKAINKNKIGRGITVIGQNVGGLEPVELSEVLSSIAKNYASRAVIVQTNSGEIRTTTGEIGIEVHIEETFKKVLELDKEPLIVEPFRWVKSFFEKRSSPIAVQLIKGPYFELPSSFTENETDPIEPSWIIADGQVQHIEGVPAKIFNEEEIRD